ncbi:hypothetical protein HYH02_014948 [Chlamydomonas schloesseri]|uniref:RNB domain-containing protein n=1 Tax=Chlamydomonas schloesseri TaxID=2026947 RepID=A0A835SSJ6_9CHLO|nr:hypothetical protein HYH02_014948 [Chlamydomonas schloesseri]|eukprot:KAG2425885.1 hypothetical protein HYH02_014948 [Chlamydomonas schloesseri]
MASSTGRFGSDPAYQAALDAAARSSVLAATSGLGALSVTPPTAASTSSAAPKGQSSATKSLAAGGTATASAPRQTSGKAAMSTLAVPGSHAGEPAAPEHAQVAADKDLGRRHNEPKKAPAALAGTSKDKAAAAASGPAAGEASNSNAAGSKGKAAVVKDAMPGRYSEHLDQAELQRGFKSGQVFRGKMRVNAGDRREAYITIPGLPHDVLLRGDACQNRAIEGDEVAVALQPLAAWFTVNKLAAQLPPGANSNDAVLAALKSSGADLSDGSPWQHCTNAEDVKALVAKLAAARPELRTTGKVVAILTPSPKREHVVGLLQLGAPAAGVAPLSSQPLLAAVAALQAAGSSSGSASTVPSSAVPTCYLMPLDPRLPRCVVRPSELKNLPTALLEELVAGPDQAENRTLMSARIAEWSSSHHQPAVTLRASLGQAGEIESETAALLEMEGIRSGDFEPDVLACLPPTPWRITEADIASRRDFRSTRIFSIDPPTAKDLDDALSISPLPGGGWRVGVHIADVAHFIPPFSALDVEAGKRATSTYLVQRVIPMLPPLLCEELCSLNPGVERFAFSVEWELDDKGAIKSTWFGRSVIRSCAKLSYPLVQAMIEGRFDPATCPVQLHGGATWDEVVSDSLALWGLAKQMRAARFSGGALRLDGVRLFYQLDKDGNPLTTAPYVQQEANQLVEEFMLLANMSVADCIADTFRDRAMLRRHPPPNATKLKVLQDVAAAAGLPIDISSASSIHNGLNELRRAAAAAGGAAGAASSSAAQHTGPEAEEGDQAAVRSGLAEAGVLGSDPERNRRTVELLVMLATRPMQLAEYFCTGLVDDEGAWRHYALAVRAYTHFTSPIRRYPDVVVHRLLAAALDVRAGRMSVEEAAKQHRLLDTRLAGMVAEHCNDRRLAARNAQDGSLKLYLCVLLRRQPVVTMGTVSSLGGDRYFAVYIPEFGHEVRVELEEAGVSLQANFNPGTKVLTLMRGGPGGEGGSNGGNGSSGGMGRQRKGFGSGGGRGGSHGHNGGRQQHGGGGQECKEVLDLATWVSSLAAPPRNPHGLQPARLPLHLRLFSDLPVVLTAVSVPGEPSQLVARMYLQEAAAAVEGMTAAKMAEATKPHVELETAVSQSQISWENQLND